ncbi:MAG: type IV pilus assembly protein PilM [Planctomycetota bacterium]
MAKTGAVWGIDIGQCALKALRCRPHEKEPGKAVVEAFDYIEYPKILSQPDADREELIREALETFLSRNEVEGDRIAISVPGQSGLARFIKLPPVEQKKIPDIVKYEARQQIPFALEDVVWDYQPLLGGSQDEGYALETEVGLFAMKRDQVARALEPLDNAGLDVDIIQLAPLSVYNYVCFDRLGNLEEDAGYDAANPPPATVVLSFGADTTDLVITNGMRVWQRNIPIGGSHFTKALTKEMRITFAKAEHLKRNATQAENPKAVFQAMRPVFSDLVGEIQRSLGFYMSNNRDAKLGEVIALGNPMKLPGLERYLAQNLEQPVKPIDSYQNLSGGSVTSAPQFKENLLSFAVAYGLCVQGLESAKLGTNLLPDEIVTDRLIRAKKPWAVIAAALLLLGFAVNYLSHVAAWNTADLESGWDRPIATSKQVSADARNVINENEELKNRFDTIYEIGENLQSNTNDRLLWLELLKAVDSAIPKDARPLGEREQSPTDVTMREELHIESMEVGYTTDVSKWFSGPVKKKYEDLKASTELMEAFRKRAEAEAAAARGEEPPATDETDPEFDDEQQFQDDPIDAVPESPSGEGWIVELSGHHFHNSNDADPGVTITRDDEGNKFLRRTLITNLLEGSIELPDDMDEQGKLGKMVPVSLADLGISFPVVVYDTKIEKVYYDPTLQEGESSRSRPPRAGGFGRIGAAAGAGGDDEEEEQLWELRRYEFKVQFVWQPRPRHERAAAEANADEFADQASSGDRRVRGANTGRLASRGR